MLRRVILALVCFALALALGWGAVFGLLCIGWMPNAGPSDIAWRWLVGIFSMCAGACGLGLVAAAVMLLAHPVAMLRDALLGPATK